MYMCLVLFLFLSCGLVSLIFPLRIKKMWCSLAAISASRRKMRRRSSCFKRIFPSILPLLNKSEPIRVCLYLRTHTHEPDKSFQSSACTISTILASERSRCTQIRTSKANRDFEKKRDGKEQSAHRSLLIQVMITIQEIGLAKAHAVAIVKLRVE